MDATERVFQQQRKRQQNGDQNAAGGEEHRRDLGGLRVPHEPHGRLGGGGGGRRRRAQFCHHRRQRPGDDRFQDRPAVADNQQLLHPVAGRRRPDDRRHLNATGAHLHGRQRLAHGANHL